VGFFVEFVFFVMVGAEKPLSDRLPDLDWTAGTASATSGAAGLAVFEEQG
jgi:hypothetical protein